MKNPRRPDHTSTDDDVEGHAAQSVRVQPPRDESGDVHGHAQPVAQPDVDDEDDVEGHKYVRPEDNSREG